MTRRLLAAALVCGFAMTASAEIKVRQSGSEFSIEPLESTDTVEDFYRYNIVKEHSSFTGLELPDTSLLFFYRQTSRSEPLSLVFIHDLWSDLGGGRADFTISGLPDGVRYVVRDDEDWVPGEGGLDTFSPDPPTSYTRAKWVWLPCCTDGAALSDLRDAPFCISVYPSELQGMSTWQALSGPTIPPPDENRHNLASMIHPVYLCKDCHTLDCPEMVTEQCQAASSAQVTLEATGGSLCPSSTIINSYIQTSGANASGIYLLGETPVTFTLFDVAGFRTECESLVVVEDTELPTITNCPGPLTITCDGEPVTKNHIAVQSWLGEFEAEDSCSLVTLSHDLPEVVSTTCVGQSLTVTFTATDESNNVASCTAQLAVVDLTAPRVDCPPSETLECQEPQGVSASSPSLTSFFAGFEATDECTAVTASHNAPASFPSGCGAGQTTNLTYEAEDQCSNSSFCTTSVTVRDTTAPSIDCPADKLVECSDKGGTLTNSPEVSAWKQGASASDLCGAATLSDDLPALAPAGCSPGTATTATFTAEDDCGLQSSCGSNLTVVDTTPPSLTCPLRLTLECDSRGGTPASNPLIQQFLNTASAEDICHEATLQHNAPSFFHGGCRPVVPVEVTFTADDGCANIASCTKKVRVEDKTAPAITSKPSPLTLECNTQGGVLKTDPDVASWLAGFQAEDVCHETVSLSDNAPLLIESGCTPGHATPVTFTASDPCSNEATQVESLTVVDTTPPSLNAPDPVLLECSTQGGVSIEDPYLQAWLASASAADICDGAQIGHNTPSFIPAACNLEGNSTPVTFQAQDNCGNVSPDAYSAVSVVDTTPPALTVPVPLQLECDSPGGIPAADPRIQLWLASVTAYEICSSATITHDAPEIMFPSGCLPGATTTVTFTAVDVCGNMSQAISSVTVIDSEPPDLTALMLAEPMEPPMEPEPPGTVCWKPTSRIFMVDCGIDDACDPSPELVTEFRVMNHFINAAGECEQVVDYLPAECGEIMMVELRAPPCPTRPRGATVPPDVERIGISGIRVIMGESVELEVTGTDQCGNTQTVSFDPAEEPSPLCELSLVNGECCPAVVQPPDPRCTVLPCDRCTPTVAPLPEIFAVTAEAQGCTKGDAKREALLALGQEHCVDQTDPLCDGGCQTGSCLSSAWTADHLESAFSCWDWEIPYCRNGSGFMCSATGSFVCTCKCGLEPDPTGEMDGPDVRSSPSGSRSR